MISEETKRKARECFSKIRDKAREAMAKEQYDTAFTLVRALKKLQFKYGGGIPVGQIGCDSLIESYEAMRGLIKEPIEAENWAEVSYVSEFLAAVNAVLADEW